MGLLEQLIVAALLGSFWINTVHGPAPSPVVAREDAGSGPSHRPVRVDLLRNESVRLPPPAGTS